MSNSPTSPKSESNISTVRSTLSPTEMDRDLDTLDKFEKTINPIEGHAKRSWKRDDSDLFDIEAKKVGEELFAINEEEELDDEAEKKKALLTQNKNERMNINHKDSMNGKQPKFVTIKNANTERTMTRLFDKKNTTIGENAHKKTETDPDVDADAESDYVAPEDIEQEILYRHETRYRKTKCILFPDDKIRKIWDIILVFNLLYTGLITPFSIAFIAYGDSLVLEILDLLSYGLYIIDIFINFFSAYLDREDNLITNHKKIACNYITGWFFIDFLSSIPIDLIFDQIRNLNKLLRLARLPRLYKLIRLAKLARMLKVLKEKNKFLRYLNEWLKLEAGIERLFWTITSFFIVCHITACIWYLVGDINSDDPTNWIFRFEYSGESVFVRYMNSFYYIAQTFVTVGYGDINPGNTYERIFVIFLMFAGAFLYSLNVSSIASILSNLDAKYASFEEKMNILLRIKQKFQIDQALYSRIKRALKYGHNKDLFEGIDFFERHKRKNFMANIGSLLKLVKLGRGEYIFTEGEYANEMYFIKSGTVSMVIKEFNNFPFLSITAGYYFGEIDLLFSETRKFSILAETDCELLTLKKKDFFKIFFQEFRDIGSEIYNHALKRKIRALKAYREAVSFCKSEARAERKQSKKNKYNRKFSISHARKNELVYDHKINALKNTPKKTNNDQNNNQPTSGSSDDEMGHDSDSEIKPKFISKKLNFQKQISAPQNEDIHELNHQENEELDSIQQKQDGFQNLQNKLVEIATNRAAKKEKTINQRIESKRASRKIPTHQTLNNPLKKRIELQERIDKMEKNLDEIFNLFTGLEIENFTEPENNLQTPPPEQNNQE